MPRDKSLKKNNNQEVLIKPEAIQWKWLQFLSIGSRLREIDIFNNWF